MKNELTLVILITHDLGLYPACAPRLLSCMGINHGGGEDRDIFTGPAIPTRQDFWPPYQEDKGKAGANLRHAA